MRSRYISRRVRVIVEIALTIFLTPIYLSVSQTTDCGITWLPAVQISPDTLESFSPSIATQGDTIHVTWYQGSHALQVPYVRSTDGLAFEPPRELVPFDSAQFTTGSSRIVASLSTVYMFYLRRIRPVVYPSMWMRRSFDRGDSWDQPMEILSNESRIDGITLLGDSIVIMFQYLDSLECGYNFLVSTNSGNSWSVSRTCFVVGSPRLALSRDYLHFVNHRYVDGCTFEVFYRRSSDLGATWSDSVVISACDNDAQTVDRITASPEGHLYVTIVDSRFPCNFYGCAVVLYQSIDDGETWIPEKVLSSSPGRDNSYLSVNNNVVSVVWTRGPSPIHTESSTSFDGGISWCPVIDLTPISDPAYRSINPTVSVSSRAIAAGWEQRAVVGESFRIWCRVGILPSAGVDEGEGTALVRLHLDNPFPNPFNGSVTFKYELATRSRIQMKIYNTLGQQVAYLDEGERDQGEHAMVWQADGYSSGLYLFVVTAGKNVQTGKIIVLR